MFIQHFLNNSNKERKKRKSLIVVGGLRHARAALTPGKRLFTHSVEGWMGIKACLDWCRKSRFYQDSIPDRPVIATRVI